MVPVFGGPSQSTAPEPLLPSPGPLFVDTGTPVPDGQAEMSPTEKALIVLHRADEAMKPIDRANTWKGTISRIKWVAETVSPIAEVRTISIHFASPRLSRLCSQLHPFAKMAYGLGSAIPKVRPFASFSEQTLMLWSSGW